jgi:integrase
MIYGGVVKSVAHPLYFLLYSPMSSVYHTGKTWVYQYSIKDSATGFRKRAYKTLGNKLTKKEAKARQKELDVEVLQEKIKEAISPTHYLSVTKDWYIEQRTIEVEQNLRSPNTLRTDIACLKLFYEFMLSSYGDIDIKKIDSRHISRWEEARRAKTKSPATVAVNLRTVKSFFTYLVVKNRLQSNPFKGLPAPRIIKRSVENLTEIFDVLYAFIGGEVKHRIDGSERPQLPEPQTLSTEDDFEPQLDWFFNNDWFVHYLWIMLNTGMRSGEVSILKWKRGKDDSGEGHSHSYSYVAADKAAITIYFKKRLREISVKEPVLRSLNFVSKNSHNSDAYVFQNPRTANPFSVSAVGKLFKRLMKNLQLNEEYTPHAIRHGYASLLSGKGIAASQLAKILGHTSEQVTEQYYLHSRLSDISAAMDVLYQEKR